MPPERWRIIPDETGFVRLSKFGWSSIPIEDLVARRFGSAVKSGEWGIGDEADTRDKGYILGKRLSGGNLLGLDIEVGTALYNPMCLVARDPILSSQEFTEAEIGTLRFAISLEALKYHRELSSDVLAEVVGIFFEQIPYQPEVLQEKGKEALLSYLLEGCYEICEFRDAERGIRKVFTNRQLLHKVLDVPFRGYTPIDRTQLRPLFDTQSWEHFRDIFQRLVLRIAETPFEADIYEVRHAGHSALTSVSRLIAETGFDNKNFIILPLSFLRAYLNYFFDPNAQVIRGYDTNEFRFFLDNLVLFIEKAVAVDLSVLRNEARIISSQEAFRGQLASQYWSRQYQWYQREHPEASLAAVEEQIWERQIKEWQQIFPGMAISSELDNWFARGLIEIRIGSDRYHYDTYVVIVNSNGKRKIIYCQIDPYKENGEVSLGIALEAAEDFIQHPEFYPESHFQYVIDQVPNIGERRILAQALFDAGYFSTEASLGYANTRKGRKEHYRHEGLHLTFYQKYPQLHSLTSPFFIEGPLYALRERVDYAAIYDKEEQRFLPRLFLPFEMNTSLWEGEEKPKMFSSAWIIWDYIARELRCHTRWGLQEMVEEVEKNLADQDNLYYAFYQAGRRLSHVYLPSSPLHTANLNLIAVEALVSFPNRASGYLERYRGLHGDEEYQRIAAVIDGLNRSRTAYYQTLQEKADLFLKFPGQTMAPEIIFPPYVLGAGGILESGHQGHLHFRLKSWADNFKKDFQGFEAKLNSEYLLARLEEENYGRVTDETKRKLRSLAESWKQRWVDTRYFMDELQEPDIDKLVERIKRDENNAILKFCRELEINSVSNVLPISQAINYPLLEAYIDALNLSFEYVVKYFSILE